MRWIRNAWNRLFGGKKFTATICGHTTKLNGEIKAYGESISTTLPQNGVGSTDYCLECIGKMTIRCAWCRGPIFIGEPITLYTPQSEKNFDFASEHAVVYQRKPLQLVGCLRWKCAESGADRAGFWIAGTEGKGKVHRVRTAFEEILAGKGIVVVGDLRDLTSANPLQKNERSTTIIRNKLP